MIKWAKKVHLKIKYQQESLVWIKALKKMTCLKQYVCLLLIAHPVTFLGKLELVPFLWLGAASRLILVSVSSYWVLLGETLPRSPVKVRQGSSEHFLLLSGKYAPAEGKKLQQIIFPFSPWKLPARSKGFLFALDSKILIIQVIYLTIYSVVSWLSNCHTISLPKFSVVYFPMHKLLHINVINSSKEGTELFRPWYSSQPCTK